MGMTHATLYGVANDRSTIAAPCVPWEFESNVPVFKKKDDYLVWRADAASEHLLFLNSVGVNPALRPNAKTNPIRQLTCLIADYDVLVSDIAEGEQTEIA